MKFTNHSELPEAICKAIANDEYDKGDAKYSVSNLIQPVQAYHLIKRNIAHISVDYADEIWKLFGSAVHYILDKAADPNDSYTVTEDRLYMKVGGIRISGKPDWRNLLSSRIEDYKVTSVWKVLKGDYKDWEQQLNIYRLLADHNGEKFDSLRIIAILKDWKKYEMQRDENYPKIPVARVDLPVWNLLEAEKLVLEKVIKLETAESLADEDLASQYPCSPEERWHKADTFAAMKPGNKRASATFDTHDECFDYIQSHPGTVLEVRPGEDTRCQEFCLAKPFCRQFNKAVIINQVASGEDLVAQYLNKNPEVKEVIPNAQEFLTDVQMFTDMKPVGDGLKHTDEILTTPEPTPTQTIAPPPSEQPAVSYDTQVVQEEIAIPQPTAQTIEVDERNAYEKSLQEHRERAFASINEAKQTSQAQAIDNDIQNLFKDLGI